LVSNSDAHSPSKIGREANAFDAEFSYRGLVDAIKSKDPSKFLYTIEFFPEEGKYHYDGHRKCGVLFSPKESIAHNDLCPECGKKLTIGVMHRIEELADREEVRDSHLRVPYKNLIPLNEIIAKACEKTPECQSVRDLYFKFIREFENEQKILTEVPISELTRIQPEKVGQGIDRMRKSLVKIVPGHDGEYGVIRLFEQEEEKGALDSGQLSLF
jgi:uncharacterized protein (TIGR00375 family)